MKAEWRRTVAVRRPQPSVFSPWPHRLAVILACATFPLLFIGGLVTSKGAGLAVPDWPTTFGYNMFLYPWSKMVGNIFYEHSHRLVASAVGLLTIALALTFWFRERRHWLRWLGVGALGLVICKAFLAACGSSCWSTHWRLFTLLLRRRFLRLTVSSGDVYFAGLAERFCDKPTDGRRAAAPACAVTTGLIYLQAIFGAVLRHTGERLDAHLRSRPWWRCMSFILIRVTRHHSEVPALTRPALLLFGLLMLQLALGTLSYWANLRRCLG